MELFKNDIIYEIIWDAYKIFYIKYIIYISINKNLLRNICH